MSASFAAPRRILVTGGRGRLASLVADHFRGSAHDLQLFSRTTENGFRPLDQLADPASLAAADTVLHLAWSTLPATSEQHQGREWQEDLPRLEKILAALATLPANRRPHFVFFSSGGAVYGNAPGRPNREDDPCNPIGWYGRGKRAAEEIIQRHAARHGLPVAILRIANPYGYPVPVERAQGIIPHAVRSARDHQPLTLWGDGHARKDFLHYSDFLGALEQVIARRLNGTFNLCAGESHSVLEIIALVEKHTGGEIRRIHTTGPAWDVTDSRLDPGRFIAATGWRPLVSLDEGIRRAAL
jgi:UDP-glucose 4-epimerase